MNIVQYVALETQLETFEMNVNELYGVSILTPEQEMPPPEDISVSRNMCYGTVQDYELYEQIV